ncbi:MAG: hypothetical protein D6812_01730 [Deltaproteobacteria bacterium]|nr:MAG: hypothetical protein D6812_01730 [Deltaproteobacteria bacterium]
MKWGRAGRGYSDRPLVAGRKVGTKFSKVRASSLWQAFALGRSRAGRGGRETFDLSMRNETAPSGTKNQEPHEGFLGESREISHNFETGSTSFEDRFPFSPLARNRAWLLMHIFLCFFKS